MKKKLQILFCVSLFAIQCNIAFASHIVGGELIYRYLGNSQYEITLKVYRDCYNGLAAYDNPSNVFVFDVNGNLAYTLPITFPGSDTLDNGANNPCLIVPPNICVEEAVFVYNVTLPDNPGGYSLLYQRCCRNFLIQNIVDPSNT
ncbi:MAG: hypothetical protein LH473_09910, partial [Chitinophagales bacterium]|nr:hypothetical protein [Chitinophagales bacterium]